MTTQKYGCRDDVPVVFTIGRLGGNRTVEVKGDLREVIQIITLTKWQIYRGEVDIDQFLEWHNRGDHTKKK